MKILLIHPVETKFQGDRVSGGLETVFKNQLKLLAQGDYDVGVFVSDDSTEATGAIIHRYGVNHKSARGDMSSLMFNKRVESSLNALLSQCDYDFVINHGNMNKNILRALSENNTPSMTYIHNAYAVAGGIAALQFLDRVKTYKEAGGRIIAVSKCSADDWNSNYEKRHGSGVMIDDVHHTTVVWDKKSSLLKQELNGMMAARLSPDKRILSVLKANPSLRIYSPPAIRDKEREYADEITAAGGAINYNYTHSQILSFMEMSKYVVVAGPESYGLVAIEAASVGTPVVLDTQIKNHPAFEIAESVSYDFVLRAPRSTKLRKLFYEELDSNGAGVDRTALVDSVYTRFNPSKAIEELDTLISEGVRLYSLSTTNNNLMGMFG